MPIRLSSSMARSSLDISWTDAAGSSLVTSDASRSPAKSSSASSAERDPVISPCNNRSRRPSSDFSSAREELAANFCQITIRKPTAFLWVRSASLYPSAMIESISDCTARSSSVRSTSHRNALRGRNPPITARRFRISTSLSPCRSLNRPITSPTSKSSRSAGCSSRRAPARSVSSPTAPSRVSSSTSLFSPLRPCTWDTKSFSEAKSTGLSISTSEKSSWR